MKNFIFKSPEDLQKMFQYKFDILNQNLLYCTRQLDKILVDIHVITSELNLTKQANEYYERDEAVIPRPSDDVPATADLD